MDLQYFVDKKLTFVLIKRNRVIYKSKKQRLAPLLFCLGKYKAQMRGATVFDKVVGRAAALLLVYGGVKKVMAPLISRGALAILKRGGAEVEYGERVENILNRLGDDLCSMEKLSQGKNAFKFAKIMKIRYNISRRKDSSRLAKIIKGQESADFYLIGSKIWLKAEVAK
ncbi:MAG: hypothetical protein UW11_C0038G0010 [Parcubacteria group bacterium GW2011_GWA2_43_9b]|uniref:DUF1893 domain-containing protein n=1 Tax=Candidatus Portnoybacteria bacterium RIFCSPLOWO2_02_FULL_39_11 TaxID=1802001 RepID=A0A1G2FPZ4_9BACT|nr:MAG: hypothetical protein UW11_C0038G0010 [Parcubacteria group bacterium GW2011_GWA2_43_9b]OGZ40144.1 MAG: hypothetical protein A3B04_03885 [Candidatus Portnoybacteria bacterium RIFCSPLOWO2_02_FULL_39_11]